MEQKNLSTINLSKKQLKDVEEFCKLNKIENVEELVSGSEDPQLTNEDDTVFDFFESSEVLESESSEDLLSDDTRHEFLERTKTKFGVQPQDGAWKNPPPGSVNQSKNMKKEMIEYYKNDNETPSLRHQHISYINEILTPKFFMKLGYQRL